MNDDSFQQREYHPECPEGQDQDELLRLQLRLSYLLGVERAVGELRSLVSQCWWRRISNTVFKRNDARSRATALCQRILVGLDVFETDVFEGHSISIVGGVISNDVGGIEISELHVGARRWREEDRRERDSVWLRMRGLEEFVHLERIRLVDEGTSCPEFMWEWNQMLGIPPDDET